MIRVVSSDQELLKKIAAHAGSAECLWVASADLCARLGDADLFFLSDSEAQELATNCESASRPTVVVVAKEGDALPAAFAKGLVDDLITLPLRAHDVERVIRMHEQMQVLKAVEQTSRAVPELVKKLQEDIQLAQKIQRRLIKEKFPLIGGLSVKSKYWCGLKAGGDYFDVFEFPDGVHTGVILSDSSSYSISTSFIGSLMQFSVHVSQDDLADPARIVAALYGKLKEGMKEKDRFSILYGILNRKTYQFRYVDCGPIFAAHRGQENGFQWIGRGENPPLSLESGLVPTFREVALEPGDRMMILSDGWGEAMGRPVPELLESFLGQAAETQEVMNAMALGLRKGVEKVYDLDSSAEEEFPMPPQDCSVLFFELAKNVLRLARS
jgi:serine phosphatase RsbU (regulator of sigma subunit)